MLSDLGPHLIDQALQLFGMPDAVERRHLAQRADARVDDYFDVTLHYGRMRVVPALLDPDRGAAAALRGPRHAGSFVKYGLDPQEAQLKAGMDPRDRGRSASIRARRHASPRPTDDAERCRPSAGAISHSTRRVADAILDGAPPPVEPRRSARRAGAHRPRSPGSTLGRRCRSRAPVRRKRQRRQT